SGPGNQIDSRLVGGSNGLGCIAVIGNSTTGNSIRGNQVPGLAIDLGGTGALIANDSLGHNGPNLYQDYPVIEHAAINANGHLVVSYSVPAADISATYPLT